MKYILTEERGEILYGKYLEEFSKIRHKFPDEVVQFVEDENRFCLQAGESLHDAWIESLVVRERRSLGDVASGCEISLELLGQLHDRRIVLCYREVKAYSVEGLGCACWNSFHGDIYTHEVRLSDDGFVIHEIVGADGFRIQVECETFQVDEKMLTVGFG